VRRFGARRKKNGGLLSVQRYSYAQRPRARALCDAPQPMQSTSSSSLKLVSGPPLRIANCPSAAPTRPKVPQ
jgi:hypothetical protein